MPRYKQSTPKRHRADPEEEPNYLITDITSTPNTTVTQFDPEALFVLEKACLFYHTHLRQTATEIAAFAKRKLPTRRDYLLAARLIF